MQDTHKYLVHARITADGVVERSDVVGAVFGQTEGLLGDELDLRDLQESSRIGRIDVEIDSEHGQSFGYITIASSLDKAETAILGAALEAITRVGPCEARVEVAEIEDMRAAKRREIVDRAKELLRESFDESVMDSTEILEEVREVRRVEGIVEYEGLPAGPRVADSDAVILVEGRSDVVTLLGYGIKNAVAVEGTNVPDEIADLTRDRTVTAFLDGDRGGDLILRELAQVGEIDYVAAAPDGRSVEDLSRGDVMDALREKVPFGSIEQFERDPSTALTATDEAESDGGTAVDPGSSADPTVEPGTSTEEPTPGDSTDRVTPESGTGGASSESDVSSGDDLSGASDLSSAGDTSETADASRGSRTDAETTETSGATPGAESPSVETASGTTVTDETETASGVESASGAE
ncbi:MAG: DNA primase DnaG, partial [Halobaculum sp.]